MIAISGCLLGINCRYDGGSKPSKDVIELADEEDHIAICPEALGGLKSPREPSEIIGGDGYDVLAGNARVISRTGEDVTNYFISGAEKVLEKCVKHGVDVVYLKENSPSCGVNSVYDGTFEGNIVPGIGVLAALLKRNGIEVVAV